MKKFVVFTALTLCILASANVNAESGKTMSFTYYHDYAPFGWEDNGKMRGIYIDTVNEALTNRLGISVEHRGFPWSRAQSMVKEGKADGFCTVITPERLKYSVAAKESLIDVNFKIFAAANNPNLDKLGKVTSIPELQGFKLVDYRGSGWAKENLEKAGLNIHWLGKNEQLWKFLAGGRADATVKNEWTTRFSLKKLGYQEKIVELPHPMLAEPTSFHIFIGKKSKFLPYLGKIDEALKNMKADGTMQSILDRYK